MPNRENRKRNALRRRARIENKRARQQQRTAYRREAKADADQIEARWRQTHHDPLEEAVRLFAQEGAHFTARREEIKRLIDAGAGFIQEDYVGCLNRALGQHRQAQIRPLEAWRLKGRSTHAQLRGLISHLFVRYPTPAFLYRALEDPSVEEGVEGFPWSALFVLVAGGGRRKEIPKMLGVPLTKRMIKLFLAAKARKTPLEALRAAQVGGFCEDKARAAALVTALMNTRLGQGRYRHGEARAQEVIHWFTRQEALPSGEVGPLMDYIEHAQEDEAWSINGRTVASLGREAQAWHLELARIRKTAGQIFPRSPFRDWKRTQAINLDSDLYWRYTITEIPTSKALSAEGRAMGHCVYSYARHIAHGRTSIWSLKRQRLAIYQEIECVVGEEERLLTIEVRNDSRTIPQARGRFNRSAKDPERALIRRWAKENGLRLSRGV